MNINESIEKQTAILGQIILSPDIFAQALALGIKFTADKHLEAVWNGLVDFATSKKRHPKSLNELGASLPDEKQTIAKCARAAGDFGDDLIAEVKDLAKRSLVESSVPEIGLAFEGNNAERLTQLTDEFLASYQKIKDIGEGTRTAPSVDRFDRVAAEQLARKPEDRLSYGIQYLDDCLYGIGPGEFAIVSADTGVGKTQLFCSIARKAGAPKDNGEPGLKVGLLALEARSGEIEERLLFDALAQLIYGDKERPGTLRFFEFDQWRSKRYPDAELAKYMPAAIAAAKKDYASLFTTYRDGVDAYTVETMRADVERCVSAGCQLILIDHIHHIDAQSTENEIQAVQNIVRAINRMTKHYRIPIIAAAHIRKDDGSASARERLIPSRNDIYGSKTVINEADVVIMLAQAPQTAWDSPPGINGLTFLQIQKNRQASNKTPDTAIVVYDFRHQRYSSQYAVGKIVDGGRRWIPWERAHWHLSAHKLSDLPATKEVKKR